MRKNLVLLLHIILFVSNLQGQHIIGIPNIINYPKQTYNAGNQNWQIAQDKTGILYFANNDGLLSFDGAFWRLYKLPNKTIVRSVAVGEDGKIYVGGQGELGYFSPGSNGDLRYTSLNQADIADVWNICIYGKKVFFRTNKKILEYDGRHIVTYNGNWNFMGGALLAAENDRGLVYYHNGQWLPRIKQGPTPQGIRAAISIGKDSLLLATLTQGLYLVRHDTITRLQTPATTNANIVSATLLSNDRIALATNLAGVIIIDKKGRLIESLSKREGIQHNNVLSVMLDKDKNLWLGLDNGIDLVTYNNAIRNIYPDLENRNAGYASALYNGDLYLGVSTGLYKANSKGFQMVPNTQGQVWGLSQVDGKLLLAHTRGAFLVEGGKVSALDTNIGFWGFQSMKGWGIVAGTYNGINVYNKTFQKAGEYLLESARFVAPLHGIVWIAHPYKGLFSITAGGASRYADSKKILSTNHNKVFKLNERIILTTDKGLFEYDTTQHDFVRAEWLEKFTGKVSYLKQDQYGRIWFCRDKKLSVIDGRQVIAIPEIDGRIMGGGFEHVNVLDSITVLIAAEKGFFHLDYAAYRKTKQPSQVVIRKVQHEAVVFGGYGGVPRGLSIPHKHNTLHVEYASLIPGEEYSYRLKGLDTNWSAWTKKAEVDFDELPAGDYTFNVKCRGSAVAAFSFTILPPLYQTWWAYLLYTAAAACLIYVYLQQVKIQEIKNKKLLSEIEHKKNELATFTMGLVRNKEILSRLRQDLSAHKNITEVAKVIKTIDKELDINEEQEIFAIHHNYLQVLKERYPGLTSTDLKLAAYLRHNLTTKEIAQLMNISVRGVETSRYRLRKKLELDAAINLHEFLSSIQMP